MFCPRDKERYGHYSVFIDGIGDCIFEIDIAGFGESFILSFEGKELFSYDTEEDDFDNQIETDTGFRFTVGNPYYKTVCFSYSDMRKLN